MTSKEIIQALYDLQDPEKVSFKQQKFGVIANNSLGIYHKELKIMAKDIGMNSDLAIELFDSGIYEARLLCSKLFKPKDLTDELMEKWVVTFENWEICDSFCMGVFAKSKFALPKIHEWSQRTEEFEKRAAFAIMAAYCMADKKAPNEQFEAFFPIIIKSSTDERLYVKKAVNWALRNIGKRNIDLNHHAIEVAEEILTFDSKAAQWIAKDAIKELQKDGVRISDYPRDVYRPAKKS